MLVVGSANGAFGLRLALALDPTARPEIGGDRTPSRASATVAPFPGAFSVAVAPAGPSRAPFAMADTAQAIGNKTPMELIRSVGDPSRPAA